MPTIAKHKEQVLDFLSRHVGDRFPPTLRATAFLQGFGLMRVPLLFSVRPKVVELNERRAAVKIPLNRWTRNHLGSMYFGTLAIGADCVVGILAFYAIQRRKAKKVHLSFKDFQAEFLRRPEGSVLFCCDAGPEIEALVDEVLHTGERKNLTVPAYAALAKNPEQVVARFLLTLSLKRKGK